MPPRIKRAGIDPFGWREEAQCQGVPVWVFSNDEEPLADGTPRPKYNEKKAKAICKGCPVRVECLENALDSGDFHVIRGGLNEEELRAERRRRLRRAREGRSVA